MAALDNGRKKVTLRIYDDKNEEIIERALGDPYDSKIDKKNKGTLRAE